MLDLSLCNEIRDRIKAAPENVHKILSYYQQEGFVNTYAVARVGVMMDCNPPLPETFGVSFLESWEID